jgi:arginine:ornithine antiporter / lysine permease
MVFAVFASVTIVSYGILPYNEIAELRQPSVGGVLEAAYGQWGKVFISIGLIVSVLGAYLAWTLMAAEVLLVAAKDQDMPRFLGKLNEETDVPTSALLMTTVLIQVVLLVASLSDDAFNFALDLTSALSLIPFVLAAGYALKLSSSGESYVEQPSGRNRELVLAAVATLYTLFLLVAAGPKFILVSFIVYALATVLFVMSRREQGRELFSPRELVILAVSVLGAVAGVVALAAGWITL